MSNAYNIYKLKPGKLDELLDKLARVGLREQKTKTIDQYDLKFYFSEGVEGNEVWWWKIYNSFFNDDVPVPKNIFHFGLLVCTNSENPEVVYIVSLGKSHFYLNKFIELDFGIDLAIRMADEDTILLKKSRYFSGSKRQDISSYTDFVKDNYESGESVDHLKLKAANKDIWGGRNIICADSIQLDISKSPDQLVEVFGYIDDALVGDHVIDLPKLEQVKDLDLISYLDDEMLSSVKELNAQVAVEEFNVHGVNICFNFSNYSYEIFSRLEDGTAHKHAVLGDSLNIEDVQEFLLAHDDIQDINLVKVRFRIDGAGWFVKEIKEVLDFNVEYQGAHYFLNSGEWYKFNQVFLDYLKRSLESIDFVRREDLVEKEFLAWQAEKKLKMQEGEPVLNNITYREYYFNEKMSLEQGYVLLDRELEQIPSLSPARKKYKVEVADLYRDEEIVSVKISSEAPELIFNIEQSKAALELIKNKVVREGMGLKSVALWVITKDDIDSVVDFKSILFLLALDSWAKRVRHYHMEPRIYLSKHVV